MIAFVTILVVVVLAIAILLLFIFWQIGRRNGSSSGSNAWYDKPRYAREAIELQLQRETLETLFFKLASESGRPRGLKWTTCDFGEGATFAIHKPTQNLRALVGVEVSFTAIEGGGMEHNPNVGNVRAASAVFEHDGQQWTTLGRVVFNLEPHEAIAHFEGELAPLEIEAPPA